MTDGETSLQRKLKLAGYLLIAGLGIDATTLVWAHPTSFLAFICVGSVLVAAGIFLYLTAIISR